MRIAIVLNPCDEGLPPAGILKPDEETIFRKKLCPFCRNRLSDIYDEPLYSQNGYSPSKRCGAIWSCATCDRSYFIIEVRAPEGHQAHDSKEKNKESQQLTR